jgi:hypothetical protein
MVFGLGLMLLLAALTCGGCARWAFSSAELELLEASAADARFMDRTWAERSDAERRQFVYENAEQWTYFSDLAHGRQPASISSAATAPTTPAAPAQEPSAAAQ